MQESLRNNVLVVTGGFGAAGLAIATEAKARGARVALIDFALPPAGLDFDHIQARVDMADHGAAHAALDAIAGHLGPIDSLLNIAGGFEMEELEHNPDAWERMFRVNLLTAVQASHAAIRHLRSPGGSIVNVAAAAAGRAASGMGPYSGSKAGVLRLTESLAEELKPKGIRANAVSPTTLDTPANRTAMPKADPAKWVSTAELAEVVLFLASSAASGVTGAEIRVAGRT